MTIYAKVLPQNVAVSKWQLIFFLRGDSQSPNTKKTYMKTMKQTLVTDLKPGMTIQLKKALLKVTEIKLHGKGPRYVIYLENNTAFSAMAWDTIKTEAQ